MIGPGLAFGLLQLGVAHADSPDELRLSADRITVEGDRVWGEGSVRALLLEGEIEAERFEIALDGSAAALERGCWRRPDGLLCFEQLEILEDGTVLMDRAVLSLCSCEGPRQPWSVQARRVRVDPQHSAVFVGGLLRVAGCPVLPLPAGVFPLGERRSGLLAPRVAWTPDGLELGQPLYLTLGRAADLEIEPSWRQQRGARLASELRWALPGDGGGRARVVGGWDSLERSLRGMAELEHGWVDRDLRTAVSGSVASDEDYSDDYELDFTRRQQGFHELRALAGLGPFRLDHDGFQAPAGATQRLVGLSFTRPSRDPTVLSPSASLDLSLGGHGPARLDLDQAWLVARPALGLAAGRTLGPLETEGALGAQGLLLQPVEPSLDAAAGEALLEGRIATELRATLPLWADHGSLRHLLRPSLVVGASVAAEDQGFEPLQPRLGALPATWVGPRLESRWLSAVGVPLEIRAELPWSDLGLAPGVQAWWSRGPWWGSLQGAATWRPGGTPEQGLAWLEAGHQGDALRVSGGVLALQEEDAGDQLSARIAWRLPLGSDRWEPRARARWSLADAAFVERHLGLYFASRCDCLGLELGATWAEDREWPDLGLRVDLGRGR